MPVTIPILRSADFDRTVAFYARLGFQERARWPDDYLILHHHRGIEIHFWHDPGLVPASNDAGCYVRFPTAAEANALYAEWRTAGLAEAQLRPPQDPGYNLLEFAVLDDDRNSIRVGGVIEPQP